MKTIYIDEEYMCHVENDGTMTAYELPYFDNMCDQVIESHMYIPQGETYEYKGQILIGEHIQAVFPSSVINTVQQQANIVKEEEAHIEEIAILIDEIYNQDMEMIENV